MRSSQIPESSNALRRSEAVLQFECSPSHEQQFPRRKEKEKGKRDNAQKRKTGSNLNAKMDGRQRGVRFESDGIGYVPREWRWKE